VFIMLPRFRLLSALVTAAVLAGSLSAAPLTDSLRKGTPDLKSAGALAFGPDGVLFVADTRGAAIFAIDTADTKGEAAPIKVEDLQDKLASLLGTDAKALRVNDLAVNPASGKAYLSVMRGQGPDAKSVIVRIGSKGEPEALDLKDVKFARAELPNAPAPDAVDKRKLPTRPLSITDLAYVNGQVIVAGLSSEEFSSKLRSIPFPFKDVDKGASVEIFHTSHNRLETDSPVRTFALYDVKGEVNVLAAYTCTPLVRFPLSDLKPGAKVHGQTIAELGNGNQPLDMIVYEKGGKKYLLVTNTKRGVMKVSTDNIDSQEPLTERVADTAGLKYETIKSLADVDQLDKLDNQHALVLRKAKTGAMTLETVELP